MAHEVPVKVKNLAGWTPLAEAISYGDRQIIVALVKKIKEKMKQEMEDRRPQLLAALKEMGDFYVELKWDFHSWVPLVSRVLPSDVCRIHKRGPRIRMDTTLVDFNDMRWERGDLTFIFDPEGPPQSAVIMVDNSTKLYQRVMQEEREREIEDEVDLLMSSDILSTQMSTKSITFSRAQSGWFFREDRKETVGAFEAEVYQINGMVLETRKRREHLSQEDLKKNKAIMDSLIKGKSQAIANGEPMKRRASLNPPPESRITWDEYVTAPPGECPLLGRSLVYKESSKAFKATVAMCPDFPLTLGALLNVLEVLGPFKHFSKLREFVQMKLPPGFPVKVDIPIVPTVTAKITFQEFRFVDDMDEELFRVPDDYIQDSSRFDL